MSDEQTRALERRWRTDGDLRDLARWLQALAREDAAPPGALALAHRIDEGLLDREDLLLAALLGEPSAGLALLDEVAERCAYRGLDRAVDVALREAPGSVYDVREWLLAIGSFRRPWLARALLAATRPYLDALRRHRPEPVLDGYDEGEDERGRAREQVEVILVSIETWLDRGDDVSLHDLRALADEGTWFGDLPGRACRAAIGAAQAIVADLDAGAPAAEPVERAVRVWAAQLAMDVTPAQVREAVRMELLTILLR